MPRPKRTKVASAIAKPQQPVAPAAQPPKTQTPIDAFSDDSDGLVVRSKRTRRQPRERMPWQPKPQKDVDFTMTGALPASHGRGDEEGVEDTGSSALGRNQQSPRAVTPSHTPTHTSKRPQSTRGSTNTPAMGLSQVDRVPATQIEEDAFPQDEESSLLDPSLLTFGSLDSDSPAHGTRPPSAMKVGGTPAHEISILALTNFKRRARQPSLMRMVRQTTDVEDNDDLDDLDDMDDFSPDDESTPLHVRKAAPAEEENEQSGLSVSSSASRGKKRKLSSPVVVQVLRSSPPPDQGSGPDVAHPPRSSSRLSSPPLDPTSGLGVVNRQRSSSPLSSPPLDPASGPGMSCSQRSSSPSLPEPVIESLEDEFVPGQSNPEVLSDTMAPPRSSSPPVDNVEDSIVESRRQRNRTRHDSESEGAETERPKKARSKHMAQAQAQSISTAKLQALLPRRRTRATRERTEYDFEPSDDGDISPVDSDQDELQLPQPRKASAARKTAATKTKKASRATKKSSLATATATTNTRTYGRRSSDKENENGSIPVGHERPGEVDEATETTIVSPNSKLAAMAKKFEDVDAWEMEYENVDLGGGSSSPWR